MLAVLCTLFKFDVFSLDRTCTIHLPRYGSFQTNGLKTAEVFGYNCTLKVSKGKTVAHTIYKTPVYMKCTQVSTLVGNFALF